MLFQRERVLIESDWNLKIFGISNTAAAMIVLIESDWNLKTNGGKRTTARLLVLIESDWNLKLFIFIILIQNSCSINRIRLEFKVIFYLSVSSSS